jgi:hypothetical protein
MGPQQCLRPRSRLLVVSGRWREALLSKEATVNRYHIFLMALLALIAVMLFTCPAHSSPVGAHLLSAKICRDSKGRFIKCPTPTPTVTWTKCADENGICYVVGTANVRYGSGSTWTASRSVASSIACDNATWGDPLAGTVKECDTDGTVGTAPAPTPTPTPTPTPSPTPTPTGSWISAPLSVGGYAFVKGSRPDLTCCNGLIIKLLGTNDSGTMMLGQFYADPSGNFPTSAYETGLQSWYDLKSIQGVAPAP